MSRLRIVLIVVFLLAAVAWMMRDARAFDCLPRTSATITASGTAPVIVRTPAGRCGVWWCPVGMAENGGNSWKSNKQCVLEKYRTAQTDPLAIAEAFLTAPDATAAITAASIAALIVPTNPQDAYDFAYLQWSACQAITKPENMPPNVTLTLGCGDAPTPPGAPKWVVAKNGTSLIRPAFPVTNGKRSFSSDGTVAVGSPCSEAVKFVEGSLTFLQVSAGHVAVCSSTP